MGTNLGIKFNLPKNYDPSAIQTILEDTHQQIDSVKTAGEITIHAGALPSGYLQCNGALVNRIQYSSLFSAIGIKYGAGDGKTTFQLPSIAGPTTGTLYIIKT